MMTVMGDALVDGLSDAGSTPARSIMKKVLSFLITPFFYYFLVSFTSFSCITNISTNIAIKYTGYNLILI